MQSTVDGESPIEFPYVEVPEELLPIIGEADSGTRLYRKDGSQEESAAWFDLVTEIVGPTVSPGGVRMFCPVSRAAVYKRMNEGRLSAFLFHVQHVQTKLFGDGKIKRDTPFVYIPVLECQAWRRELEARAKERGKVTQEELEGAVPDWYGDFLEWRNKEERYEGWDHVRDGLPTLVAALKDKITGKFKKGDGR